MIAIAPIRRRRIIDSFYTKGAFDEERACSLESLALRNNLLIRKMVETGVLVKTSNGRYYLNEKPNPQAMLGRIVACQAKVVVDEKNVLQYLLKKIDLID